MTTDNMSIKEQVKSLVSQKRKDGVSIVGVVIHEAWHADGTKFIEEVDTNTITNTGLAELANLAGSVSTPTAFTYLANGSDNTAAAASQTALVSENTTNGAGRASATVTRQTTTVSNDTLQLVHSRSISGAVTVQEVGVFNAASTGIMLGRQVVSSKSFDNGDTYQLTYQIVFA